MANRRRIVKKKSYSQRSLHQEREYGFYWYAWLWHMLRPMAVFLCSLLIVLGILVSGWNYLYRSFLMPMSPGDQDTVTFVVGKGNSVTTIAKNLVKQDLLRSKSIFKYMIMFQGLTNKLQYGNYQLSPGMSVGEIIEVLTTGSSSTERTITIVPGWTVEDIGAYLLKLGALTDLTEFNGLCNNLALFEGDYHQLSAAASSEDVLARKYALEGYLAPDTYRVFTDASAESLLRTLLGQMEGVLDDLNDPSAAQQGTTYDSGLTQDELIILASMIEKEAVQKEDFAKVSAVFHNRLKLGMRLESDPTVKYTANTSRIVLTAEELAANTAYNTYVIYGLPAGPICNPSKAALDAAMNPNSEYLEGGYLYFCSTNPKSGELYFSKTLAEHEAAVAEYRPLWEAYDAEHSAENSPAPDASPTPAP